MGQLIVLQPGNQSGSYFFKTGAHMIMRHSRWMLLLLAAAFLLAQPLQAADFTIYAGSVIPGSVGDVSLDGSPIFGVRVEKDFVPLFGMEHTLAFSSDYLFPKNFSDVTSAKGFVYNGNLIVDIPVPGKNFVPYITAGAGLIHQYGNGTLPVGTKFAFNYGGGFKFPHLFGPMGLRLDMRGYNSSKVFYKKMNMFEISGGVLLSMGK